ncbi:MAG: hypothetical protein JRJ59_08240, partial [Deltaproteobacteria bacterium]|nr:hypothetical protein [Deltaproteobacteria bacterium]
AASQERINQARRVRKQFGGGMRQIGILAAAGLYALERNLGRLAEDHQRAKRLAQGLTQMKGVNLDPEEVETNIVIFDLSPSGLTPAQAQAELESAGARVVIFGPTHLRAVLHLDIDDQALDQALTAMSKVLDRAG